MPEHSEETTLVTGGPGILSRLAQIGRRTENIDRWANYVGVVFTILLMLMTVFQVVSRAVFGHPFKGYIDAEEMMMALMVFLSLAYCQLKGDNIRYETLMTKVFKDGRGYHAIEAVYLFIAFVGFAMIAIYSMNSSIYALATNDVTLTTHWPIWPFKLSAAIGSVFLCLRFLAQIVQNVNQAIGAKVTEKT